MGYRPASRASRIAAGQPNRPAARLVLSLLGPPQVWVRGRLAVELKGEKVMALLAYLALEGHRVHRREALAALFWPEQREPHGLQNLRQTLSRLRRALGEDESLPPLLVVEPQTIGFNMESDHWLDVAAFQALVAAPHGHAHRRLEVCPICLERLSQAVELYQGEFLEHLHPAGSPAFDEWLLIQREHLGQQVCAALQALARAHLARGDALVVVGHARRLLRLDPWDEEAQRLLLRGVALGEGRNAALQRYQAFRRELACELGVEPEDETSALAAEIEAGLPLSPQSGSRTAHLPAPATPLVGRQAELRVIGEHLAGQEQRLLTFYGPGGCGKTRLALEVAAGQVGLWRDGVWFVPLTEVPSPEALVDVLALALGFQPGGRGVEARHLLDWLRPRELLLVLDAFEHLVGSASLPGDIVRWAPEVRVLVTSRTRLGVPGEWAVPLEGLALPSGEPATVAEAEGSGAVQLFVQSARRVAPAFRLSPENLPHVARICRLVDCLPLGIELAAAWVRLYRCRQIADELERSLDFLHPRDICSPQGHHSLRGTFDYSYAMLPAAQRTLLRSLSVFRGGFGVEAAWEVAGAGAQALDSLLDRSLLQASPGRRLGLHAAVSEYAAEKLAERPGEDASARERHSCFYLGFLRAREDELYSGRATEALGEIQGEIANVRAAWQSAVAQGRLRDLDASLDGLSRFYHLSGHFHEAETEFGAAFERLAPKGKADGEAQRLACRLLVEQARSLASQGRHPQVLQVATRAAEIARASHDVLCEARAVFRWGEALWRLGDLDLARTHLEHALSLFQTGCDAELHGGRAAQEVETSSLNCLAAVRWMQGHRTEAESYLQQALNLAVRAGNRQEEARILGNLGVMSVEQGNYAEARHLFGQSLRMHQASGNRRGASMALGNLGNVFLYLGAYAEAGSHYAQALQIQREIGDRHDEALSLGNLGLACCLLEDHQAARVHVQRALEMAQEIGERRSQAAMWLKLGHVLAGLEQMDEAAVAYRQSVDLRRELGMPNLVMEPLAGLARVSLAQGDLGQALLSAEEILSHLASAAPSTGSGHALDGLISPFEVYLTCYQVLQTSGDPRVWEVLTAACALLRARAEMITDPSLRRSFLENVVVHRELVQALQQMEQAEKASAARQGT